VTGRTPPGHVGPIRLNKFDRAAIADYRVQRADVVLGDDLEHGLGQNPETVCHAGSNDDQVTFSAGTPLISAVNQDRR
jgi:hypothetical protein